MPSAESIDLKRSLLWLLALLVLCGINYALFRTLFALDYFDWYRHAGPVIGLATAVFSAAWGGMDKNTGLISADPRHYCGACLQVAGLPMLAFGGHLRHQPRVRLLDYLFGLPLIVAFALGGIAWLLLVAPLQYFVFLICGAPSRLALRSAYRVNARMEDSKLVYLQQEEPEKVPASFWDASLRDKPVVLAGMFSTLLWLLLDCLH
ncbi:MAG: hypothetical protein JWL63_2195 [Rhodocyclales bacterium]|nr:hypothetical protein [Rhodocyclales bacterium]